MAKDDVFKALADANRRKILKLLGKKDSMSAGEIADEFDISKPAISDHLKILRNAELIYAEKRGQYILYQLNATVMQEVTALLFDLLKISDKREPDSLIQQADSEKDNGDDLPENEKKKSDE